MALLHSTAQRNGTLAGVGPVMSAYNGGSLRIFGGTAPTSADAVEPSAPLAVVPMPASVPLRWAVLWSRATGASSAYWGIFAIVGAAL